MSRSRLHLPRSDRLVDISPLSRGRSGPSGALRFSSPQLDQIARTVRRVPEVIVKVSGGGRELRAVKAHLSYIDRHGRLAIETDDGRSLSGKDAAGAVIEDWALALSRGQYRTKGTPGERDRRPKLVHNLVLSMPGRTPAEKVLAAARTFAREQFALQYRYAMVLHTDQAHPHVHLVVKAEHERDPSRRLQIRKATLRQWREEFAACLREEGVAANATPAWARGQGGRRKKDPIHHRLRAVHAFETLGPDAKRGRAPPVESRFMRAKVEAVAAALKTGMQPGGLAEEQVRARRQVLKATWLEVARDLREEGHGVLAAEVEAFVGSLPPARTEQEAIAAGLMAEVSSTRQAGRAGPTPPARSR